MSFAILFSQNDIFRSEKSHVMLPLAIPRKSTCDRLGWRRNPIRYTKDNRWAHEMHGGRLKRKKTEFRGWKHDITIESIVDDTSRLHDYGFSRSTWHRGVRLMKRLGSDQALGLLDGRADRALARGDVVMCQKWRDLMAVIHAIEADEPQSIDRIH